MIRVMAVLIAVGLSGCGPDTSTPKGYYQATCTSQMDAVGWGGVGQGAICACRANSFSEILSGEQLRNLADDGLTFFATLDEATRERLAQTEGRCTRDFCKERRNLEPTMCSLVN